MAKYVSIDRDTGELVLNLPDHVKELGPEAAIAVQDAFAFEGVQEAILYQMDLYIVSWLADRGYEVEEATR